MSKIKLVNENGVIKGIDPETGDEVPVEFDDLVSSSVSAGELDINGEIVTPDTLSDVESELGAGEKTVIPAGGDYTVSSTISIASNTTLIIQQGTSFTLADSLSEGTHMFENADTSGGNSNINVIGWGGTLDCNRENQSDDQLRAISLVNCDESTVDGLRVTEAGQAIRLESCTESVVRECHVSGTDHNTIWFEGCTGCVAEDNILQNPGSDGVDLHDGCEDCTADGNTVIGTGGDASGYAINLHDSIDSTAVNNRVFDFNRGVQVWSGSEGATIRNNTFVRLDQHGVFMNGATTVDISQNYFEDINSPASSGTWNVIGVWNDGTGCDDVTVKGNTVAARGTGGNPDYFVRIYGSATNTDTTVRHNEVRGVSFVTGTPVSRESSSNTIQLNNEGIDDATSQEPQSPYEGMEYLDDGTNTSSGNVARRYYDGSSWVDFN